MLKDKLFMSFEVMLEQDMSYKKLVELKAKDPNMAVYADKYLESAKAAYERNQYMVQELLRIVEGFPFKAQLHEPVKKLFSDFMVEIWSFEHSLCGDRGGTNTCRLVMTLDNDYRFDAPKDPRIEGEDRWINKYKVSAMMFEGHEGGGSLTLEELEEGYKRTKKELPDLIAKFKEGCREYEKRYGEPVIFSEDGWPRINAKNWYQVEREIFGDMTVWSIHRAIDDIMFYIILDECIRATKNNREYYGPQIVK